MKTINKTPSNAWAAKAAVVTAVVIGCAACCISLVTPLALALLASLGVYSASGLLTSGGWTAAAAVLALSPVLVWWLVKRLRRPAPSACAISCSCQTAGGAG